MKVLYAPARQRVPSKAFEWSNGTYSLLLDKLELDFGVTLEEEDFSLLLDTLVSLLLDFGVTLEEDFALLLDSFLLEEDWRFPLEAGMTEEEDFADSLDFGATLEEDFTLLLESSQSSQIADEDSSPGSTTLLPSSSQAAKTKNRLANAVVNKNLFHIVDNLTLPLKRLVSYIIYPPTSILRKYTLFKKIGEAASSAA